MNKFFLNTIRSAAVAIAMIGTSAAVWADVSAEDAARFVKSCDTNNDGMISKAEVRKRVSEMLNKVEADKNGMVDAKKTTMLILQLEGGNSAPASTVAFLSKADVMKRIESTFDKMDTAKKGMLNMKQVEAFLRALSESNG